MEPTNNNPFPPLFSSQASIFTTKLPCGHSINEAIARIFKEKSEERESESCSSCQSYRMTFNSCTNNDLAESSNQVTTISSKAQPFRKRKAEINGDKENEGINKESERIIKKSNNEKLPNNGPAQWDLLGYLATTAASLALSSSSSSSKSTTTSLDPLAPSSKENIQASAAKKASTIPTSQKIRFLEEIERNPENAIAYNNLGTILAVGEIIKLPDGSLMNQQELYLKAIQLDSKFGSPYYNLALTLLVGGRITLNNGISMTEQQLYVKAIQLNPTIAKAYVFLGATLQFDEIIWLNKDLSMDSRQLFLKAIEVDSSCAEAYHNLAANLQEESSIRLNDGTLMTKQELYLKAIELKPKYAVFYSNLAATLPTAGSIRLNNGSLMTKKQLYDKAIEIQRGGKLLPPVPLFSKDS